MAKVLIVDDEQPIRRTLKEILEFEKFKVEEASDGLECLVQLKKTQYDVILMDIKMPVMDGYEATREIRKTHAQLPILAMTANAIDEQLQKCLDVGMNDWITKPIDEHSLVAKIKALTS